MGMRGQQDQGGRIDQLIDHNGCACKELPAGQTAWIGMGRSRIDWNGVQPDAAVYKNDDPRLNRRLRQSFSHADPQTRQPIDLEAIAVSGQPLRLTARLRNGVVATACGDQPLDNARARPATKELLEEKLGRLGGTPFRLGRCEVEIKDGPMVPMALLNQMRRDLVSQLVAKLAEPPPRSLEIEAGRRLLDPIETAAGEASTSPPQLAVLCRTLEQLRVLCEASESPDLLLADFHDIRQYRDAVSVARDHGVPIGLASVRMQKPGEMGLIRAIGKHQPDWILARNLAVLGHFRDEPPQLIADFSLNVANHRSAEWLRSIGAERMTVSYDLNRDQLAELVDAVPSDWLEVVVHQRMPMFHMEHCVYCAVLSPGTNKTNCGRPCDRHLVQLRDRVGAEHRLEADVACRNTLYNATPQSAAELVESLVRHGVGWFRVELLDEDPKVALTTVSLYRQLLHGQIDGPTVWSRLRADNRVGVTRGTLEAARNPLAIL